MRSYCGALLVHSRDIPIQYKTRAVVAQTARRRSKVLSTQYFYYFRAYRGKGLYIHGDGVTTRLYFAIFAAFKESMTSLRGHSRSYILAAIESPCTTLYKPL